MINREKRDLAAEAIKLVLDGKLDGIQFLDDFPLDKRDRALEVYMSACGYTSMTARLRP